MHRLVRLGFVALLFAGCATSSTSKPVGERARPQVVVLDIEGVKTDRSVLARVEELAARRFDVIDADSYWDAARRLKAKKLTRKNIAKVAAELNAVAVVHGKASGKKRRQVVTIYVRDAQNGKLLERHRLTVRNGKLAKKGDRRLARTLLAKVKGPVVEPEPVEGEEEETASTAAAAADKGDKKGEEEEEEEEPDLPPVQYDESGQAVDDELPPM